MRISPLSRDRYALYEGAVQSVQSDLDFFERVYRRRRGRRFRLLREDFCGTASTACDWVLRGADHRAWGVDRSAEPLAWARRHHLPRLGDAASRVELVRGDVRDVTRPRVDVVSAMNFSYWVFKRRAELIGYFRQVRRSLRPGGLLFLGTFGGTEAMSANSEQRRVAGFQGPDGQRIPGFLYVWEQAAFNPVDHGIVCHIHFKLGDGTWKRRAFTYDWRLWTLPEVREALAEAGFAGAEVYVEGWDDRQDESDGIYRRRGRFENQDAWIAVVVGVA